MPSIITIPQARSSTTVSLNQVSVVATAGDHMVFITGTGNTVTLSGGSNTINDTGGGNIYVIPAAGKGYDPFTSDILTNGDTLDLRTALGGTNWAGAATTLSIAPIKGGVCVAIATIDGATIANLTGLLPHALT